MSFAFSITLLKNRSVNLSLSLQAAEFFVFAGLIVIFAIIFAFMSKFYDYLEPGGKDEVEQDGTIEMDRRAAKKNDDYVTQTSRQDLMEARS